MGRVRLALVLCVSGCVLLLFPLGSFGRTTANSWSGTWSSNWGTMTLTQSGSSVTGTYTHDQGQIKGTLSGDVVTGTWNEAPSRKGPMDAGDFEFTLKRGKSFTGKWRYARAGDPWKSDWTGTCTGGACLKNGTSGKLACQGLGTGCTHNVGLRLSASGRGILVTVKATLRGRLNRLKALPASANSIFVNKPVRAGEKRRSFAAEVTGGSYSKRAGSGLEQLQLSFVVGPTTDPDCPRGTTGTLLVTSFNQQQRVVLTSRCTGDLANFAAGKAQGSISIDE